MGKLGIYVKSPVCTCDKCTCELFAQWEKHRHEERVHQFLMGLDDSVYGTVHSNIIAQDPIPMLNRAYKLVIQEERHQNITRTCDV